MWVILRAELVYNKQIFLYILLASFFSLVVLHHWPLISGEIPANTNIGYISLAHILAFFIITIVIAPMWREKRVRQHALLPVSPRKTGAARLAFFIFCWGTFSALFFLFGWFSKYFRSDTNTLLSLTSQTGLGLIVYSIIFYWSDLRESLAANQLPLRLSSPKVLNFLIGLLVLSCGFLGMAGIIHLFQQHDGSQGVGFLWWAYRSPAGVLCFLLTGLGMSLLTIISFCQRKTYLG